jgi:hypothetical protein
MACDPVMPDKLEKARLEGAQSQLGQAVLKYQSFKPTFENLNTDLVCVLDVEDHELDLKTIPGT